MTNPPLPTSQQLGRGAVLVRVVVYALTLVVMIFVAFSSGSGAREPRG